MENELKLNWKFVRKEKSVFMRIEINRQKDPSCVVLLASCTFHAFFLVIERKIAWRKLLHLKETTFFGNVFETF